MDKAWKTRGRRAVVVGAAVLLHLGLVYALVHRHEYFLTWDDFSRTLYAAAWSAHPYVLLPGSVWPPLQFWLEGIAYRVADAMTRTHQMGSPSVSVPVLLNTVAMIVAAFEIGAIARQVVGRRAGVVAVVLALLLPWSLWYSVSGLAEPVALALCAGGVAAWLRYRTAVSAPRAVRWAWLAAAWALLAMCAWTRYDYWGLLLVLAAVTFSTHPGTRWHERGLAALGLLAGPVLWLVSNQVWYGSPLWFVAESAKIYTSAYGSATAGLAATAWSYARGLVAASWLTAALELCGAAGMVRRGDALGREYLGIVVGGLVLLVVPSIRGGVRGDDPEKFLAGYVLLALPLAAGCLQRMHSWVRARRATWLLVGGAVAFAAGCALDSVWNFPVAWNVPQGVRAVAAEVNAMDRSFGGVTIVGSGFYDDVALPVAIGPSTRLQTVSTLRAASARLAGIVIVDGIENYGSAHHLLRRRDVMSVGGYWVFVPGKSRGETHGGWTYSDPYRSVPTGASWPLYVRFPEEDPKLGEFFGLTRRVLVAARRKEYLAVTVAETYGHGNLGVVADAIRVGGRTVWRRDIGLTQGVDSVLVGLPVSPVRRRVSVAVGVDAYGTPQPGWGWGPASLTAVEDAEILKDSQVLAWELREVWIPSLLQAWGS